MGDVTRSETLKQLFPLLCKGRGFCGAMGNDASRVAVVVCRGSLVRAQEGEREGSYTGTPAHKHFTAPFIPAVNCIHDK